MLTRSHVIPEKISKKIGRTVPAKQIFDVVEIIQEYMYDELANNRPFYIDKFGVITQTIINSKRVWSRKQQKFIMGAPERRMVLRVHSDFQHLIGLKKAYLRKTEGTK